MAIIRYESFNYMDINGESDISAALLASGGWLTLSLVSFETTKQRTGRGCLKVLGGSSAFYRTPADQDELIIGYHQYLDTSSAGSANMVSAHYDDGATTTVHVEFERNLNNAVVCKRGDGTVLGTSANGVVVLQNWQFFEWHVKVADAPDGIVTLYVDASPSPIFELTGIDTRNGSSAIFNLIELAQGAGSGGTFYDNFRVWDTTGALHNTITGVETELDTLLPNGAGDASQWTPNGAATNWEAVSDSGAPDGDATYNEATTVGFQDLHHMEALASNRTNVRGLQVSDWARRSAGGSNNQKLLVKSNGSVGTDAEQVLGGTYRNQHYPVDADPFDGLEWTVARVNDHQAGHELT